MQEMASERLHRVLDERGQLLRAAVGFAECLMPLYDRALWALRSWLDSWAGIGRIAGRHGTPELRSATHAVRRARLAGDVLHDRDGALDHERDRIGVGAHAVARDAAGGVRGVEED